LGAYIYTKLYESVEMFIKNRLNGGEKASSIRPNSHSKRLVYIRYWDHIIFWNSDPSLYENPNIREVVGWVEYETDDFICITYDRSVKPLPYEKKESGLVISKSAILEIREIRKPY
jgi:hypothetical protein